MKVTVDYYPDGFGFMNSSSYQEKSFKTETDFIIWYDKHYEKIGSVTNMPTSRLKATHFQLLAALKGFEY